MTGLDQKLKAFLDAANDMPMVWGDTDCSSWPARWVEAAHGRPVPLPRWSSREEALALMDAAGSLSDLWEKALSKFGLYETGAPGLGDVGIIKSHQFSQSGGIFLDRGYFAWRAEPSGFRILRPRAHTIVKVWSIQ